MTDPIPDYRLDEYLRATHGLGSLAQQWASQPRAVVEDLVAEIKRLRAEVVYVRDQNAYAKSQVEHEVAERARAVHEVDRLRSTLSQLTQRLDDERGRRAARYVDEDD